MKYVVYNQQAPITECTITVCGVNYQLLAQWSIPIVAVDHSPRKAMASETVSNWLAVAPNPLQDSNRWAILVQRKCEPEISVPRPGIEHGTRSCSSKFAHWPSSVKSSSHISHLLVTKYFYWHCPLSFDIYGGLFLYEIKYFFIWLYTWKS